MRTLTWFTHTNISTKDYQDLSFDLSEFIEVFLSNQLWDKMTYRTEYDSDFDKTDLEKIKSITINIHTNNSPYSNAHQYENVLEKYFDLKSIEQCKVASSGISEATKIAVVIVEFESSNKVIDNLSYKEEKNIETVFEKKLTSENHDSWLELSKIKSIVCEFIQFFNFNMHLNFLTHSYDFSFSDRPELVGFTYVEENGDCYYETDKIDFFAHYILYEEGQDNLLGLMRETAKFWHKDIPSIHFFLDALKGNNITSITFIKLLFTVESFYGEKTSNDFISLTTPLLLSDSISKMKEYRRILTDSFSLRNNIVHGNKLYNLKKVPSKNDKSKNITKLFFEIKNLITYIFYFYINQQLYHSRQNEKINHELIFRLFPHGIEKTKKKNN